MAVEIERKFLLKSGTVLPDSDHVYHIRQCYLNADPTLSIRVRIVQEDEAFITIKKATEGTLAIRSEYEYPIPLEDAIELMQLATSFPIVKQRHTIQVGDVMWEVDFFEEENEGLIMAEVELKSLDQPLVLPEWVGREVTHEPRYMNNQLSRHPYAIWAEEDK